MNTATARNRPVTENYMEHLLNRGMTIGDITADYQLGHRQMETWCTKLTNAQRMHANELMANGSTASKAITEAKRTATR